MNAPETAVRTVLSKYAVFKGRATRSEFWWWVLCIVVLMLIAGIIDGFVLAPLLGFDVGDGTTGQPLSFLLSVGLLLPNIAVGARRLHDFGKSGWLLLLGLVPVLGFLVLLYFYVQPSTREPNTYGPHVPFEA